MDEPSPDQPSAMANRSPDWPPGNITDREHVLMGDYFDYYTTKITDAAGGGGVC